MTATEELRSMLDERGVEWLDSSDDNVLHTTWNDMNCWFNEFPDGWTAWGMAKRGTPEQAIAATLGNEGSYTRDDVESAFVSGYSLGCLPVGSDPRWDQNEQTVDEHMAELGWVRAATLGSELPYDELLRCLENDWHISASWDGLRKFWCIELTEEGVKLRNSAHSTLTAEQVRDVIELDKAELLESCEYLGGYEQRTNDVLKAFGKMEQAISATLGNGECHNVSYRLDESRFHCSECESGGWWKDVADGRDKVPRYCPDCGRKVVGE